MKLNQSMLARVRKLENEESDDITLTLIDGDTVVVRRDSALHFGSSALYGGENNEVETIVTDTVAIQESDSRLIELLQMVLG